jgi:hypothetical protein
MLLLLLLLLLWVSLDAAALTVNSAKLPSGATPVIKKH